MWEALGYLLILILACYGVYYLVQDLFRFLRHQPGPPVSMLVVLRDREQDVEYLLRQLHRWRRQQWVDLDVVVVDDGSQDETVKILHTLQRQCAYRLITLEELSATQIYEDRALATGLLYCHNALVWLVDLRKLPQGQLAEKVFCVFFCQSWR